jgi:hypothetical protein
MKMKVKPDTAAGQSDFGNVSTIGESACFLPLRNANVHFEVSAC